MGGKSTGTFHVDESSGTGVFEGKVVNVPFLDAPGFIQVRTTGEGSPFPDISTCTALELELKSNVEYTGYRVSFGTAHAPGGKFFARGYKATIEDVPMQEFGSVVIPLNQFTDFWDDATGDPIHTCQENPL